MAVRLSSRVPQTLANLHQLYSAAIATEFGTDVAVTYGVAGNTPDECVTITGELPDIDQAYAGQGALSRDEAFQAEVLIEELRSGRTQQQAIERAFEILAVLELNVHRQNITLSLAPGERGPVEYSRITPKRVEAYLVGDEGYGVVLRCVVDCVARI